LIIRLPSGATVAFLDELLTGTDRVGGSLASVSFLVASTVPFAGGGEDGSGSRGGEAGLEGAAEIESTTKDASKRKFALLMDSNKRKKMLTFRSSIV